MTGSAQGTEARTCSSRAKWPWSNSMTAVFAGVLAVFPYWNTATVAQDTAPMQNTILAIGNCPPWNAQSVEVCQHSLEKVMSSLAPRLDASLDYRHLLVNEGARASALKLKATELANQLTPQDRLIIYANVPVSLAETAEADDAKGYVLELWAEEKPETPLQAISEGTFISASAFAALIHTLPAGEVILMLDTNNPHAIDIDLLATHKVDHKDRPEALVISSGPGQAANYSADRTISLFAKHLAIALNEIDGSLLDVITVAAGGTRQAAIPICAELKGTLAQDGAPETDCVQVPEIHDPETLLNRTMLIPLAEAGLN